MRIETLCTGDELLTGLTSDTNSRFFQALLLERAGLTVRRGVVVGDVREDLVEALDAAAARCDVVLVSGGLGPTTDDLTAECAARAAGVGLVESPEALRHLEARFAARGVVLTPNNRRQALVPEGAEVVLNAEGSAPMFVQTRGRCVLYFVPGVPREYRHLVEAHVVPRIVAGRTGAVRRLRLLKTVGLPESHLDAKVRPLAAQHPAVTFGFRTEAPENHLKLLAEAATAPLADAALDAAERDARAVLGAHVFGRDAETLPGVVLQALRARGARLAVAESCTGGLLAELLTAVPGASDVFFGGPVVYQEPAKTLWAQVPEGLLAQYGAVSSETAEALATGVRAAAGVTHALSTTGYAGPGGGDAQHPVGTVFLGLAGPRGVRVERHRFHGERDRVRRFAAHAALDLLRRHLEEPT